MIASRISKLAPSMTLLIADKARELRAKGIDVVSFATGEPDFDTPDIVKQNAIEWIERGYTKYVSSSGIPELKNAIIEKLEKENGLCYKASEIIVCNGAKQAIYEALGAILNPGDEVVIPRPCWVSYIEQVKLFDGNPVLLPTNEANNFRISAHEIASALTKKTKALLLSSPNNPSGAIIDPVEIKKIAKLAVENDIYVISDEVYEKLNYSNHKIVSIASLNEDIKKLAITINSLSKSYCMTGWRVGYAAANETIIGAMSSIHGHVTGNVNSIAQKAATCALKEFYDFETMKTTYKKRREFIVDQLNGIGGVKCNNPDGAFYVYPNVKALFGKKAHGWTINNATDLAHFLIEKGHVACVPGEAFALPGHLRFTFAISDEQIAEGINRVKKTLSQLE